MMSISRYEDYTALHNDFSEAYQVVNKYVLDLYIMPRKFIEETGPALDRFIREYSIPGTPRTHDLSTKSILEFISQVDAFTLDTVNLFNEHKGHVDGCALYMKKVKELERKHDAASMAECADEFLELAPDLLDLHSKLNRIKVQADVMVNRLAKLELRWVRIKTRVNE
ncbi:MAG: hypothetical protein JWO06_3548 [Bacteroidota bacterium]|nr:hypothetical protein [Bacteroidota bacterium]